MLDFGLQIESIGRHTANRLPDQLIPDQPISD
jgi:hypothetical protein